ncbi:MAG: glycoside hydrolase family 3 N-terminal domain-containing protein [Pseudomonadota bacterium]
MSDLVDRLLASMTLEEKLGQLNMIDAGTPPYDEAEMERQIAAGRIGSLLNIRDPERLNRWQAMALGSRLKIPLIFGLDVLHGHYTIYPLPIAEAGAFDPELWERTAKMSVEETGRDGITMTFAPMLDVCRDPRWGRIAECPGEDAYVASRFAEAKIRGYQGTDLSRRASIAATAKHLGAYGAVEAGRDYGSVNVSERQLAETYLPPFEAAVKAGVSTIMPAFNDVAGIPMTAHGDLLNDLVRKTWGFDGVMVSDYTAVAELIAHGIAEDLTHAASIALMAGVDIDMQDQAYVQGLPKALERGLVTMADIDRAVRRVLTLKAKLGLFDEPYRRVSAPPLSETQVKEFTALARDSARRSVVLLKNDNNTLPITSKNKKIALIGPLADAPLEMFGCWFAAAPLESVTILHGLKIARPNADIRHMKGVEIEGSDTSGIAEAVTLAKECDTIILSLGETKDMTGEAHSRGRIELPGHQRALAEAIFALGKPVIVVLSHGRPVAAPWLFERAEAVVASWFLGSEAGHGIADVMTGKWNPSAKLCVTWPYDGGQIPIFHSQRSTGRPANPEVYFSTRHVDLPIEPQFPFGHGLSYTRYALSNLKVPSEFTEGDTVTVAVDVSNEGSVAGQETLFLFLRDPVASIARPVLELKGFAKATLKSGERKTVCFTLKPADFEFLDKNLQPRFESGAFEVSVGQSADRTKLLTAKVQGNAR